LPAYRPDRAAACRPVVTASEQGEYAKQATSLALHSTHARTHAGGIPKQSASKATLRNVSCSNVSWSAKAGPPRLCCVARTKDVGDQAKPAHDTVGSVAQIAGC
jgi:hypothetical protein